MEAALIYNPALQNSPDLLQSLQVNIEELNLQIARCRARIADLEEGLFKDNSIEVQTSITSSPSAT